MFGLIGTIIAGAVIGIIARFVKPGADSMGWILTILLGIAGSYVGSLLYKSGGVIGFAISIACAVGLLFGYEMLRKKKA
jgi:uncharacterized membrane protein YeaQ/YmgE (transglycosylase-associated protein family)